MQVVHQLSHVGHHDLIAVVVKDVQRHTGHYGVAHGALLLKQVIALRGAGAALVPAAPFVHHHADTALRIIRIHHPALLHNNIFHIGRLCQQLVPLFLGKLGGGARRAAIIVHCITVYFAVVGMAVQPVKQFLEKAAGPIQAVAVGAAGHKGTASGHTVAHHSVFAVYCRIILRRHVAAAAPVLVAQAPIRDVEGRRGTVLPAQLGQRGGSLWEEAVFHPIADFHRRCGGGVGCKTGLSPH